MKKLLIPQTATQLFAGYEPTGEEVCFYCCGRCEPTHPASKIVKSSFTGRDTVSLSKWVCPGCIDAMDEKRSIVMIDGVMRDGQKTRGYSWVIAGYGRRAATKSHREQLLQICLNPPDPPFVICISDSGQKHLLYRASVNRSRNVITVSLEGELISYQPAQLLERLELCKMVCAATGKPALKERLEPQAQMRVVEYYETEEVLSQWLACCFDPVTRLAAWLCPHKSECENEYTRNAVTTAKR